MLNRTVATLDDVVGLPLPVPGKRPELGKDTCQLQRGVKCSTISPSASHATMTTTTLPGPTLSQTSLVRTHGGDAIALGVQL